MYIMDFVKVVLSVNGDCGIFGLRLLLFSLQESYDFQKKSLPHFGGVDD